MGNLTASLSQTGGQKENGKKNSEVCDAAPGKT